MAKLKAFFGSTLILLLVAGCNGSGGGPSVPSDYKPPTAPSGDDAKGDGKTAKGRTPGASGIMEKPVD